MKQYKELLKHIQENGKVSEDRTGVGTIRVFDYKMDFDLQAGFPIPTTKRTPFNTILAELLFFIQGNPDRRRMQEMQFGEFKDEKFDIWKGNCEDAKSKNPVKFDGYTLGNMYPVYWRHMYKPSTEIKEVKIRLDTDADYVETCPATYQEQTIADSFYIGSPLTSLKKDPLYFHAWDMWVGMINSRFAISPRWKNFTNFLFDLRSLPCFNLFINDMKNYTLDCTYFGSNTFSRNTTIFVSTHMKNELNIITNNGCCESKSILSVNGFKFFNVKDAIDMFIPKIIQEGLNKDVGKLYKLLTETNDVVYYEPKEGYVFRRELFIDQLQELINNIKAVKEDPHHPAGRRLILDAWNQSWADDSVLGICHPWVQCFVEDNKLSLKFIMRSSDVFLGLPFNIASYALLTHILAHITGLEVGTLSYSGGDVHVYSNHAEQVREQLSRRVKKLPTLVLNHNFISLDDISMNTFSLDGYDPHPAIKAPMAV